MAKKILSIFSALIIVILFSAFIANLIFIGKIVDEYCGTNIESFLVGVPKIFFYFLKFTFYFFIIIWLNKRYDLPLSLLFISFAIPAILIDATVFIAGRQLIPLRFPFETIFPLLGLLIGILYLKNKKSFFLVLPFFAGFLFFSHRFFIPTIIRFMELRDSKAVKGNFPLTSGKFYTINNIPISFEDTLNKKCVLLEFYFVGCQPCERKIKYLNILKSKLNSPEFEIIMVCDGTVSDFNSFQKHAAKNENLGFLFFYDRDSVIKKISGDHGYPYELIVDSNNKIISSQIGFNVETSNMYLSDNYRTIRSVLDR